MARPAPPTYCLAAVIVLTVMLAAAAVAAAAARERLVYVNHYHPVRAETDRHARLYRLLDGVASALRRRGIPFWAIGGTVLGAVRHGGMIPWDDDVDLALWSHDLGRARRAVAEDLGGGAVWGREFRSDTVSEAGRPDVTIDIFPVGPTGSTESAGRPVVHFTNPHAREKWPREYLTFEELGAPADAPFGPTTVPVAAAPCAYLDRVYPGWASRGRIVRHHQLPDDARGGGPVVADRLTVVRFDPTASRAFCEPPAPPASPAPAARRADANNRGGVASPRRRGR